jgi:hypothetical protein
MAKTAPSPDDRVVSRANDLASEILAQLEGQANRSADQFVKDVLFVEDRIPIFCDYLARLKLSGDAKAISGMYYDLFNGVFDRMCTGISATASPDRLREWQEFYGPFALAPETDEERQAYEDQRQALIGKAHLLRERILTVKQSLAGQPEFIPNDFQWAILKALQGRALKKQQLAAEVCGGEGTRLYRKGGIKELMAARKVANKPRFGYYRPDALPPSP